jgi:hypothetical protein
VSKARLAPDRDLDRGTGVPRYQYTNITPMRGSRAAGPGVPLNDQRLLTIRHGRANNRRGGTSALEKKT